MATTFKEINIRAVDLPGTGRLRSVNVDGKHNHAVTVATVFSLRSLWDTAFASLAAVLETLYSVFLPKGYPGSVSPEYLKFQAMDSVQAST